MTDHPVPASTSPQRAYEIASRSVARACQALGTSEAAARFAPQRIYGGWWSPLFLDVVFQVREASHGR